MLVTRPAVVTALLASLTLPSAHVRGGPAAGGFVNTIEDVPANARQGLQFVPPASRPPLPNIDGLTPEEVQQFLGPPFATQVLKDKRLAWSYATPDGVQVVYFRPEALSAPGRSTAAAPPKPAPTGALPPDGCEGIVARGTVALLAVVMPRTPAFVTPQLRQDAVTTFAPHTSLTSLGTSGAWYLVSFQGARGPQSGYVHCSDVTIVG